MLYNKRSFNYYIRIMGYMRLRVVLKYLSRIGRVDSDRRDLSGTGLAGLRGNTGTDVWILHYQNMLRSGWSYLKARNFVHHATDGPECPRAFAFSAPEVREMFSRFGDVRTTVAHFPLRKHAIGRLLPFFVERLLARTVGWYLMIFATK
jgi:hypothetical protein